MYEKMHELKELINGPEADRFLNYYYGKYFTGTILLQQDEEQVTLFLYHGTIVDVVEGVPNEGYEVGVRGTQKEWDAFCAHKSLSVATNKGNEDNLTTLGSPIRFRQNFNVVAQLVRVYAGIR